jgi:alpha-tubulin suppressor-like RCC1 family protein
VIGRAIFLVILASGGCGPRVRFVPGDDCELNTDCTAPLVCRLGRCRVECREMRDCPAGLTCVRDREGLGACQLEDETHCTLTSDCPEPLVCHFQRCANACVNDRDCPPGARCIDEAGHLGCRDTDQMECIRHSDCMDDEHLICAVDHRCRAPCRVDRDCRDGLLCDTSMSVSQCVPMLPDAGPRDGGMDGGIDLDAGMSMAVAPSPIGGGGGDSSCALRGGTLYCWGDNTLGQVGVGTLGNPGGNPYAPTRPTGLTSVTLLGVGANHACALNAGEIFCWGQNDAGQVGLAASAGVATPTRVAGISGTVTALAAGNSHSCAIADGQLYCWGNNTNGQLGDGTRTSRHTPMPVVGLSAAPSTVNARAFSTCTVLANNTIECFGANDQGQLGNGGVGASVMTPTMVGTITDAIQVSLGSTHGCALHAGGTVSCWGDNTLAQLGATPGTIPSSRTPRAVTLSETVTEIASGGAHTCARSATSIWCWGANDVGQCAQSPASSPMCGISCYPTATAVSAVAGAIHVGAGDSHTCAQIDATNFSCWGNNSGGQLGNGTTTPGTRSTPGAVGPWS